MHENFAVAADGSTPPAVLDKFHSLGICRTCCMKHQPFCDNRYAECRSCGCAKEWHPLDGLCRVGPETGFTINNCFCRGYIPKDNLEYLEVLAQKENNNV
jgi:hypothetical protein